MQCVYWAIIKVINCDVHDSCVATCWHRAMTLPSVYIISRSQDTLCHLEAVSVQLEVGPQTLFTCGGWGGGLSVVGSSSEVNNLYESSCLLGLDILHLVAFSTVASCLMMCNI